MRVLPFTKYSPCGNTTILVRESSLSPADRARVAAEIIAPGHLEAEQAGYVDTAAPVPRLDMMGGEFCVNATRAFAALLAEEGKLSPESGGLGGIVSVSGMPERLRVRVRRLACPFRCMGRSRSLPRCTATIFPSPFRARRTSSGRRRRPMFARPSPSIRGSSRSSAHSAPASRR